MTLVATEDGIASLYLQTVAGEARLQLIDLVSVGHQDLPPTRPCRRWEAYIRRWWADDVGAIAPQEHLGSTSESIVERNDLNDQKGPEATLSARYSPSCEATASRKATKPGKTARSEFVGKTD